MAAADLQYITVDDFSPGIRQRLNRAYIGTAAITSPHSAPGAATENTFRCVNLPEGGLGPAPRRITTVTIPARDATPPSSLRFGCYMIVGAFVQGKIVGGGSATSLAANNLFLALEWVVTSGTPTRRFNMIRYRLFDPPNVDLIQTVSDTNATAVADPGWVPCLMNTYRYDPTTATNPGSPAMAYTWISGGGEAGGTTGAHWKVFPDFSVGSGNTLAARTISNTVGVVGATSGTHQGRALSLGPVNYLNGSSTIVYQLNEQFYFTAVNLTTGVNATAEVFEGDTSTGISFIQSMSADQLFINKSTRGSYMIRGDIADPTVYRLPGVPSSKTAQIPAATQDGLYYLVISGGLWLWDGGSDAVCVSPQLEDDFWGPIGAPNPEFGSGTNGTPYNSQIPYYPFYEPYAGRLQHFNDWVLIPNNWIYDTKAKSFWKIDDPDDTTLFPTTPIMHWNRTQEDFLVGSPLYYVNATTPVAWFYDSQLGATSYQWQSQPLPQSIDKSLNIREFVLTAQGTGTVTVTLTGLTSTGVQVTSNTLTFTLANNNFPQVLRKNVGLSTGGTFQSTYVQVKLVASSGSTSVSAPITYRYSVGLAERQHVPTP